MPNAKRVLQDREAAEKRYRQYGLQVESYNAEIGQVNSVNQAAADLYNKQAAEYNAFVNSVKAGQQQAVGEYAPGAYTLLKGYTDDQGQAGLTAAYADKKGNPQMAGVLVDKLPDAPGGLNGVYLKGANGTATFHTWNSGTDMMGNTLEGVTPGWQNTGYSARVMDSSGLTPPTQQNVTQAEPQVPKGWNPSRRDIAELENPTVDQAGAAQAMARGEFANQGVLGEAAARSQQLADPNEQPLTSSNKGILARVMGGEI